MSTCNQISSVALMVCIAFPRGEAAQRRCDCIPWPTIRSYLLQLCVESRLSHTLSSMANTTVPSMEHWEHVDILSMHLLL
mmetsp:Transcript_70075/g.176554  ORF Transcript_70075/g.176554 Transcript_70075/m.176554 type:complete len:80 (+) Transcript_70075:240-479(+)